jgi:GTP-binding protein
MENYLETRENLKMVFMLVDFRHKPTEDDVMMYNYLRHYDIPVTIVCTKCDKVSNNSVSKNRKVIMETLGLDNEGELTLFSSMKKIGKNEIYDKIDLIVDND